MTIWRYEIKHGPEGETDFAWIYKGDLFVATMRTHHAVEIVKALSATPAGPFEMRHEEGGYVEFLNEEVPTVVREIDGRVAILTTLEQPRKVVGYRVYDPGSSPSEVFGSALPAGVVKPLDWVEGDGITCDVIYHTAETPFGLVYWQIERQWGAEGVYVKAGGACETDEAAKSAAFADYSARIMSAIEPAGVGVETPPPLTHVDAVVKAADDAIVSAVSMEYRDGLAVGNRLIPHKEVRARVEHAIRATLKGDEQ